MTVDLRTWANPKDLIFYLIDDMMVLWDEAQTLYALAYIVDAWEE